MDSIDALILGLVQGLAEFLPISSSGHLEICNSLLGLNINGAESLQFDAVLHVATVLSTIVVLWHEFSGLCKSFFTFKRDDNFNTVLKILLSCIPVGIVGLCFKDAVEGFFGANLTVVGTCLCITAVLLAFAYFFRTRSVWQHSTAVVSGSAGRDISFLDAFIIGCAQAIAVLPGLSRSGTTIATGILLGNKREQVARFSFLMVIIPILGNAALDVLKVFKGEDPTGSIGFVPCLVGFVTAFVVGCIACKWMIDIIRRGKLVWFAVYCAIIGLICIAFG
jgi:undecaprenyl-diphosphatase